MKTNPLIEELRKPYHEMNIHEKINYRSRKVNFNKNCKMVFDAIGNFLNFMLKVEESKVSGSVYKNLK